MKQQIQELRGAPGASQVDLSTAFCGSFASETVPSNDAPGNVSRLEDLHLPSAPKDATLPQIGEPARNNKKGLLNWLRCLLFPDPPEPRKAQRESLSWLIAYFFTGGSPVAHLVRDVSLTGLYVFTEERWYLGTVVRITLTDRRQPTADRSLTLNASVVRLGTDGVGLQFLLQDSKSMDSGQLPTLGDSLEPIGSLQLKQFLERLKTGMN